jgi:hypothetical protein
VAVAAGARATRALTALHRASLQVRRVAFMMQHESVVSLMLMALHQMQQCVQRDDIVLA